MLRRSLCAAVLLLSPLAPALATGQAQTATLLIDRIRQEPAGLPAHGLTMAQVEARHGAPQERLAPVGGQKRAWPTIQRWVYPDFTVYFAHGRVVDAVAHRAGPDETGPRPATR